MGPLETDKMYLEMCQVLAKQSYCKRQKVGALVVKENTIIGIGYNGTPSGFPNRCETEEGETHPETLHAESNAIAKCATNTTSTKGATLYTSLSPCLDCAKIIVQCEIKRVVFMRHYRNSNGIKLLRKAGIEINHIIPT